MAIVDSVKSWLMEIKNNLKNKAKTEKDKETVKPTVINDRLVQ